MVHFTAVLAVLAFASPIAFSHPLRRRQVSNDTILQNGLEAQKLNAAFESLSATDSCTNGDVACVQGALAVCQGNGWVTQSCPATLQCFALPDVADQGVTIGCTSPATAQGLIEATGAQGGVDDSNNSTSTTTSFSNGTDTSFSNGTDTSFSNGTDTSFSNGTAPATVTVTVTLPGNGETQTLSPSTATLSPDQAGSIISDAAVPTNTASGTISVGTTILLSGATPAADPLTTTAPTGGAQGGLGGVSSSAASGTTIFLNGAGAATPTPSPAVAVASPATSPVASPAAGGSSGYY